MNPALIFFGVPESEIDYEFVGAGAYFEAIRVDAIGFREADSGSAIRIRFQRLRTDERFNGSCGANARSAGNKGFWGE